MIAKTVALRAADLVPLGVFARLVPREVIGFCYHAVSGEALPHVRHLYPYKTPEQFEADLRFLRESFRFVSYPELLEARAAGRPLGPNAVLLTFDDGFAECHSVVRPILLRLGIPAIFFLVTDALDNRRLVHPNLASLCLDRIAALTDAEVASVLGEVRRELGLPLAGRAELVAWVGAFGRTGDPDGARAALEALCGPLGVDEAEFLRVRRPFLSSEQARQLAADGFTLGGHTRTHPHLGSVRDPARVREEIVGSCQAVAELVPGRGPVPFAFPHDTDGVDLREVGRLLEENPWIGPVFGTARLRRGPDFLLHRLSVDRPFGAGDGETNLPAQLRRAYLSEAGRSLLARDAAPAAEARP